MDLGELDLDLGADRSSLACELVDDEGSPDHDRVVLTLYAMGQERGVAIAAGMAMRIAIELQFSAQPDLAARRRGEVFREAPFVVRGRVEKEYIRGPSRKSAPPLQQKARRNCGCVAHPLAARAERRRAVHSGSVHAGSQQPRQQVLFRDDAGRRMGAELRERGRRGGVGRSRGRGARSDPAPARGRRRLVLCRTRTAFPRVLYRLKAFASGPRPRRRGVCELLGASCPCEIGPSLSGA